MGYRVSIEYCWLFHLKDSSKLQIRLKHFTLLHRDQHDSRVDVLDDLVQLDGHLLDLLQDALSEAYFGTALI